MSDLLPRDPDGLFVIPVRPCPSWCTISGEHATDHPNDRRCYGEEISFPASKGDPVFYDGATIDDFRYAAPEIEVLLARRANDDETLVMVHQGEGSGCFELFLSVAEAGALVDALRSVLATHRVTEAGTAIRTPEPVTAPECPMWCLTKGDCKWQPLTELGANNYGVAAGTWVCDHPAGEVAGVHTFGHEFSDRPGEVLFVLALLDGADFLPTFADADVLRAAADRLTTVAGHIEAVEA